MSNQENENSKVNGTVKLNQEQMEQVSGGADVRDADRCPLGGKGGQHDFRLDEKWGTKRRIYRCAHCGKRQYRLYNEDGSYRVISEAEYYAY